MEREQDKTNQGELWATLRGPLARIANTMVTALSLEDRSFDTATGFPGLFGTAFLIGLGLSQRHPEWAAAYLALHAPLSEASYEAADSLVAEFPISLTLTGPDDAL